MIQFSSRVAGEHFRRLVHRGDPLDVFPTGVARLSETRFCVPAHWPRAHRFFAPVRGSHQDPLLIAETMRQSAMLVCHAELGVPLGDAFVMWELNYATAAEHLVLGEEPWDVVVEVACSDIRRRGSSLRSMRVDFVIRRDGGVLATCGSRISCTSAAAYHRLRGSRGPVSVPLIPALAPHTAGRTAERDVVLGPATGPGRWPLRLDTGHPTLFGRPNDHVPGILLLEAARQAATATVPGFLPVSVRSDFLRYVELDRPCRVEAGPAPGGVFVRAEQDGDTVFTCALGGPAV
ncbi:ScbA/BarX family gamma-butyrolactone biosynthesis protein [Streptomyces sp. NPDC013181]|uniref:ScbA/BarX family gamma-butyrolactone biosynthesis protein n=1 Tax=Streptomyces sp. NPDC013181 TaxID=3364864 RepID=UPI003694FC60